MEIINGRDFVEFCGKKIDANFHLEKELLINYQKLYNYLFNPSESLRNGIDPKKGLYLYGFPGSGKSFGLRVFRQMIIDSKLDVSNRFDIKNFKKIEREYDTDKSEIFDLYGKGLKSIIAFDETFLDISMTGSKYGGKKIDLHAELFTDRHLSFIEDDIKTHTTTNVNIGFLEAEKIFDARVIGRLDEMFNEIHWKGANLRK